MEKKVVVKNIVNFRAMKYFYMYNLKSKNFIVIYSVFASLCLVLSGVSIAYPVIKDKPVDWFLPAALALFSIYLLYTIFTMENKIDKNISNHFINRRPSEQVLTITDEDISIQYSVDQENPIVFDWSMITKIHEIPEYYYLFAGKQLVLIDKDPNALIEGEEFELKAIIDEKAKVKPYKLITKKLFSKPITFVHPEFVDEEVSVEVHDSENKALDANVEVKDVEANVESDNEVENSDIKND